MDSRKASWYSIVRYCSDELSGEVINVGLLLHSVNEKAEIKFLFLEENTPKIRAILNNQVDINIYKTYKESLEYYLTKSVDNMFGAVGEKEIGSPLKENFLEKLFDYYQGKKMFLARPAFSLTKNTESFFNSLFETYIGKRYLISEFKNFSVKKQMKSVFEDKKLLDRKVAHDLVLTPIKELEDIKVQVDFGFKNGVWNYLQAIPNLNGPAKNTEWFAKTKFMFENLKETDSKVHLMYRNSDFIQNKEAYNIINYLSNLDQRIVKLDLDDKRRVDELCAIIESDAHDLSELKIS